MPRLVICLISFCLVSAVAVTVFAGTPCPQVSCSIGEQTKTKFDEDDNCTRTCEKVPLKRKIPPVRKITLPPIETRLPDPGPLPPANVPPPPTPPKANKPLAQSEPTPVPPPVAIAESPTCEPGKFVVQGKNGLECMTAEERLALLENAEALVAALKAATEVIAPPPPPVQVAPPPPELDYVAIDMLLDGIREDITKLPKTAELAVNKVGELKNDVLRIDGVQTVHDARLEDNDRRFAKWSSTSFGLGISGAGGAHFLVPYKTPLPFAGGELALYFNITQDLRFLLQAGGGYGGEDYKGNSMGAISALVGIQPQVNDWFHIALGGIMEQRISSSLDFSSYGGFVEPKFCPGNDSDFRFCIGPRVSVVATSGKGPETGKPFTLLDGGATLSVGGAFLPGSSKLPELPK